MSIIDGASFVQKSGLSAKVEGKGAPTIGSERIKRSGNVPSALVASLRAKLEKLKVGVTIATAAFLPFASGCSKATTGDPQSPSAISQSILSMTPESAISLEQAVRIAQVLSSLSGDLKVVHKNIEVAEGILSSSTVNVKATAEALSALERSSKIALLGTEQALKYVPTNQTFAALQLALKQVQQVAKGDAVQSKKILSDASTTIESVGKGLSDIIERLGPAEHVVQLMDVKITSQSVHKELTLLLSMLNADTMSSLSEKAYPKVQKFGHEAHYGAKVFSAASTNSFFSTLAPDLKVAVDGLNAVATNTVTYVGYSTSLSSPEKIADFRDGVAKTLGALSVLHSKVGEELSSLSELGVIQMMTATNAPATPSSLVTAQAPVASSVATHAHGNSVFFYNTWWRPWYGGYYYDGPSHYSSGLWSGYNRSKPTATGASLGSSLHGSSVSGGSGVSTGTPHQGFGAATSGKVGMTSSFTHFGVAHSGGDAGAHVSSSSSSKAGGSTSSKGGSSVGRSGGFGGGASSHGAGGS